MKSAMSFAEHCRRNNKLELLKLYDNNKSRLTAEEIGYSCGRTKPCVCTCPDCGYSWTDITNKLNKIKASTKNYFTNTTKRTYCPYCKGERVSYFYNMAEIYPQILPYYDDSNDLPADKLLPNQHRHITMKCDKGCGFTKSVRPRDLIREIDRAGGLQCPKCGGGKNFGATPWHNVALKHPEIAAEFDEKRNNGLRAEDISPSDDKEYWFKCKKCHNHFLMRMNNRCYRGDSCSVCNDRKKTSFIEQALYYYIKKCFPSAVNRIYDKRVRYNIDILIPELETAIEYSSEYHHRRLKNGLSGDKRKLECMISYYRTISIQEYPEEFKHPLLETIVFPVVEGRGQYPELNQLIFGVLKTLDADRGNYPNIDLEKHELEILQQYIRAPISDSLEDLHPDDAKDWDAVKNGSLTPAMFRPGNSNYKFWWVCRNTECGRSYKSIISNKVGYKRKDRCPWCSRADIAKQRGVTLDECYPNLLPYWHWRLNKVTPDEITANSEKTFVFRLPDGRIVPIRICNLISVLRSRDNADIEDYLEKAFKKNTEMSIL